MTGRKAGGRLRQNRQQKIPICREFSTGATGLEPATSGVTGHFNDHDMNDDAHPIALFMRFSSLARTGAAWLSQAISDVCCPIAARRALRSGRQASRRAASTEAVAKAHACEDHAVRFVVLVKARIANSLAYVTSRALLEHELHLHRTRRLSPLERRLGSPKRTDSRRSSRPARKCTRLAQT